MQRLLGPYRLRGMDAAVEWAGLLAGSMCCGVTRANAEHPGETQCLQPLSLLQLLLRRGWPLCCWAHLSCEGEPCPVNVLLDQVCQQLACTAEQQPFSTSAGSA
jgi:hypothetical protein